MIAVPVSALFGDLEDVVRAVGTPVHVYSAEMIRDRYRALDAGFAGVPHAIHYAIKANSTIAVVQLLRSLGARADANSWGEIEVARRAGFSPADIVFTGVGKTNDELKRAIEIGVGVINAESTGEVDRISAIARGLGKVADIALRINPEVDAESHPHISTGLGTTKFGMSIDDAKSVAQRANSLAGVRIVGVHVHVGSQIARREPLAGAAAALASVARELVGLGVTLRQLDIGGGLGIPYQADQPHLSPAEYADAVVPALKDFGVPIILEPGRWIVGPAGVLVTRVIDVKRHSNDHAFVVVDAGMTELLRPALYGAWHGIEPVMPRTGPLMKCDVVGPVCETADTLGSDRQLPPIEVDDLLAVRDTGAYGAVMASNYNRRPMAAEVLVDGSTWRVVRRRQTVENLLQWDE